MASSSHSKTAPSRAFTEFTLNVAISMLWWCETRAHIDTGAEKVRLSKEMKKAQMEIGKIDKKLGNEAFVAKAPEAVVNLQKEHRAGYAEELAKLAQALENLAG